MDAETYDQVMMNADLIGDKVVYLQDGMMVTIELYEEEPLAVILPEHVTLEIMETEPTVKGQTAAAPTSRRSWITACASWCRPFARPAKRSSSPPKIPNM